MAFWALEAFAPGAGILRTKCPAWPWFVHQWNEALERHHKRSGADQ